MCILKNNFYTFLLLNCFINFVYADYYVVLWDDGPIVKGAKITFTAVLYDGNAIATGNFKYSWRDDGIPTNYREKESKSGIDVWTVEYNATVYPQGPYIAQVVVAKCILSIYCYNIASKRIDFNITETLNGEIELIQNNQTRQIYVANTDTVINNITIKRNDFEYIKTAPKVLTFWFVDCIYYGIRNDLIFPFNYTQPDREYSIEALVVADFTPLPPPITTTTTTTTTPKPTSTTIKSNTTTTTTLKPNSTITTVKPTTIGEIVTKSVIKRDLNRANNSGIMMKINDTLVPFNLSIPYVCNSSYIARDDRKTYGYFSRKVIPKVPISKINVTGNNWLQHGALLTLNVKCQGSKNLKYCVNFVKGLYNITGNETCSYYHDLEICEFTIQRYLIEQAEHTVIIIIENDVSKKVTPVTVTVYKEKKQAQLSVIVVPVSFSFVAVVLIVFGVAYYLQNRSRFIVEVADFDFGQNYSDMEYKTFSERLRDSITNAFFTRAPSPGSSEVPVWPPGRKYGSMTS